MNSVKELAKCIASIDWAGFQTDHPEAGAHYDLAVNELMKLDKHEAISLVLEVMEAKILNMAYPRTHFSELLEFDRLSMAYSSFKPSEKSTDTENQEDDLWYVLLTKLDAMAKYRDNKHFGLPMNNVSDLVEPLKHEFTISKIKQ